MDDRDSDVGKKLGRRKMLTYTAAGAAGLAVSLLPNGSAEAAEAVPTGHVAVGSWSVKATITASTGPAVGTVIWGTFNFGADGTVSVTSTAPSQGGGVFRATSANTISYSVIEELLMNGVWDGNANAFAQNVAFSSDGQSLFGSADASKFDTRGTFQFKITLRLEGTRITLTTPDLLPRQAVSALPATPTAGNS